jgi:hypothetical protein
MAYYEGNINDLSTGCCNNNSGFGFGNGWEGIIGLLVVAGLFGGGWGGFGFGGNRGGNCATVQDVASGFSTSEIMSDLNDIILGQASMQNFINQGFNGVQNTLTTSFANLNTNLCSLSYNQAQLVNGLSRELSDCCCTTQRNIDSLRYDMSKGFCDVVRAGQDNTRAILDYLTGEKIAGLQAENAGLKAQISNDRQSAYLLSELKECPKAAYIVPNPNCCYNYGVYPVSNGCGASVL